MCRAGGRRCPGNADPARIAIKNARRRERRAAARLAPQTPKVSVPNTIISDGQKFSNVTAAQSEYFADTKVVENGQLIRLYHGSPVEFDAFNPDTLGRGNDAWGNGFYFTDQESVAKGYTNESDSPTANVKEFYLNLKNPMYVDGVDNMSLVDVMLPKESVLNILKNHPLTYIQPDNEDESSFLGDYSERFWDKDTWSKAEQDSLLAEAVEQNWSDGASWVELENLFGKEHGSAFVHAVHEETGYDGVVVDFGEDVGKHYVAWFPEQMKLTSNETVEDGNKF